MRLLDVSDKTAGNDEGRPVDLSVVVVSHNHRPLLEKCLDSLQAASGKVTFELVVVDNTCADGAGEWVAANYPQAKLLRNETPRGYAANVNAGMRARENGRYVLLLNPDIECLPGLLDTLVAFMDEQPDVGIAGPKLLDPDATVQPSCRRFSTPGAILARGLHLDGVLRGMSSMRRYLMDDFDHRTVADVDWVTGALMIVRREAIAEIGVMDERYFLYSEDQDWCCRMWRGGWRVCYVPDARAVHAHMREGIRKPWSRAARYQLTSALRMFNKFGWRLSRSGVAEATRAAEVPGTHGHASDGDEDDQAGRRAA